MLVETGEADGVLVASIDDGKVNALSSDPSTGPVGRGMAAGQGQPLVITGRDGCFSAGFDLAVMNGAIRIWPRPSSPRGRCSSARSSRRRFRWWRRARAMPWPEGRSSCCARTIGSDGPGRTDWDSTRWASEWPFRSFRRLHRHPPAGSPVPHCGCDVRGDGRLPGSGHGHGVPRRDRGSSPARERSPTRVSTGREVRRECRSLGPRSAGGSSRGLTQSSPPPAIVTVTVDRPARSRLGRDVCTVDVDLERGAGRMDLNPSDEQQQLIEAFGALYAKESPPSGSGPPSRRDSTPTSGTSGRTARWRWPWTRTPAGGGPRSSTWPWWPSSTAGRSGRRR